MPKFVTLDSTNQVIAVDRERVRTVIRNKPANTPIIVMDDGTEYTTELPFITVVEKLNAP